MNAAETIAAAIEKLEKMRAAGTPGPWAVEDGWKPPQWKHIGHTYVRVVAGEPNVISGIRHPVFSTDGAVAGSDHKARTIADALLVTVLHRTIDAQLTILRRDIEMLPDYKARNIERMWENAVVRAGDLALAEAILGEYIMRGSIPDPLEGNPYDLIAGEDYDDGSDA